MRTNILMSETFQLCQRIKLNANLVTRKIFSVYRLHDSLPVFSNHVCNFTEQKLSNLIGNSVIKTPSDRTIVEINAI